MLADRAQKSRRGAGRPEAKIFHLAFSADPISVRTALRAALARFIRHMSHDEAGTLELVLAEALNNIVEHGYGNAGEGMITLSLVRDNRGLSCSISDDGVELPSSCLERAQGQGERPEPDSLPEGGFGWFLISDLVEDLGYHRANGRNLLAFRMPLKPGTELS